MFGDFSVASSTDPLQQQRQQSQSMTQSQQFNDHTSPLSMQTTTAQQHIAGRGTSSNNSGRQGGEATFDPIAATQRSQHILTNTGSMSSSQQHVVNGNLSPLEIIDQTDDDERLLQALEGLTLDTSGIDDSEQPQSEHQDMENSNVSGEKEPVSEHGTRTQFIKDVSERLISRVNTEAANIDEAKQLMQQYMMEFCAEYDRCGYSLAKSSPQQHNSTTGSSKADMMSQSDNQCGSTDRTSSSASQRTSSTSQSPSGGASATTTATTSVGKRNTDQQMLFESKILKKGVRVLSKNLQRANEQNRVKDQQLKVMRSILMHQKNQISNLQVGSSQLLQQQQNQQQFGQSAPASALASESNSSNPSPTAAASHQLTGMMNELHFSEVPDSSMMERPQQQTQDLSQDQASVAQTVSAANQQQDGLAQRAILNRSLHLQSMSNMQNFGHHQNPDIC